MDESTIADSEEAFTLQSLIPQRINPLTPNPQQQIKGSSEVSRSSLVHNTDRNDLSLEFPLGIKKGSIAKLIIASIEAAVIAILHGHPLRNLSLEIVISYRATAEVAERSVVVLERDSWHDDVCAALGDSVK